LAFFTGEFLTILKNLRGRYGPSPKGVPCHKDHYFFFSRQLVALKHRAKALHSQGGVPAGEHSEPRKNDLDEESEP